MAQIRPFQFFNAQGQPLANGKIYVTKSGKNPSDPLALLKITDAQSGEVFGGTFRTDAFGFPIGVNGNRINPTVVENAWGLFVEDADGGTVYQYSRQVSDTLGVSVGSGASTVDDVVNNLDLAKSIDLTGKDFIFIQSVTAGWEGTNTGPVNSFYAHRTGDTGSPSTGDENTFYDSVGNQFKMSQISSSITDYLTNPYDIILPVGIYYNEIPDAHTIPNGKVWTDYNSIEVFYNTERGDNRIIASATISAEIISSFGGTGFRVAVEGVGGYLRADSATTFSILGPLESYVTQIIGHKKYGVA